MRKVAPLAPLNNDRRDYACTPRAQ